MLRLIFAALVILAHAPELIDGNRSREIATSIWGTISLGTIAVDGFFLVSGYLIAQSFENSRSVWDYLRKRVLRIYPAFLICSIICVLVVGPLGGADPLGLPDHAMNATRVLVLNAPVLPGIFPGLPYPAPNGPMWTIAYEFRCYVLIALIGALGLLRLRLAIALGGFLCLLLNAFALVPEIPVPAAIVGSLPETIRFTGIFLAGTSFYLFRDRIVYRGWLAALCAAGLFGALYFAPLTEIALATIGAYAMFWFAFKAPSQIGAFVSEDISYGLYLYAWPVTSLLYYHGVTTDPWIAAMITLFVASIFGWLSWRLVERPALALRSTPGRVRAVT